MATKNIANPFDGYFIDFNEDGTLSLVVYDKDNERLEFDGKNGNLIEASSFEELDDTYRDTLINLYEETMNFFNDWNVDEDIALKICDELTPWFEKYALSEEDKVAETIATLEKMIAYRRNDIEQRMRDINADNEIINKASTRIKLNTKKVIGLNKQIEEYLNTIATLKASLKDEKFVSVEPEYTGGGIYLFTGKLADGNFFMADTANYDVRVLTEDPNEPTGMDALGITERNIDSVEWQEEHLVKDLTPDEAVAFFKEMLKWVEDNDPSGNYLGSDMDYFKEELETLKGNWR